MARDFESSFVELFGLDADFELDGILPSVMTKLNKFRIAGCKDGHFFNIEYEIQLKGEVVDVVFD